MYPDLFPKIQMNIAVNTLLESMISLFPFISSLPTGQNMEKIQNLLGSCGWDFFVSTQRNLISKNTLSASEEKVCLQLLRNSGPQNTLLLKVEPTSCVLPPSTGLQEQPWHFAPAATPPSYRPFHISPTVPFLQ
jgi:hypothetical protein